MFPFYKSCILNSLVLHPCIFFIFNIFIYFDKKKLIKELCLINLFIISSIFLSFKVYQIYLFYMKGYLFYFDDQQIYRNEYVKSWIELITYQVIINFQNYCFFNFSYSNPSFFLFQYIIERLNKKKFWLDLIFKITLLFYFICNR